MIDGLELLKKSYSQTQKMEETERYKNQVRLINYYNGDQKQYLKPHLDFDKDKKLLLLTNNITRKIIDKKSMVYKQPPKRLFNGEKNDKYNEATINKTGFLKEAERQSNLLGLIGCKIDAEDGIFNYQMLRLFTAFFDVKDPMTPIAIKYPISSENQIIVSEWWDNENHYFVDQNGNILDPKVYGWDDNVNPFGFIPIVWLPNNYIIDDWYNTAGNADDIADANETLNVTLSSSSDKFRFQSFQTNYVAGTDLKDNQMVFNYNTIPNFTNDEVTVGTFGNDHNFGTDENWNKFQVQLAERARNLNDSFGMSGSTSGFQLIVENIDNQNDIEDMIDVCRDWEQKILKMEQDVGSKRWINVPSDMQVDFTEVKMPISQTEKNQKWQFEFDNKLSTNADYWRSENPDITESEIKARYKLIAEEAKIKGEIKAEETPTIGSIFGEEI